jgi:hypothetical protein
MISYSGRRMPRHARIQATRSFLDEGGSANRLARPVVLLASCASV